VCRQAEHGARRIGRDARLGPVVFRFGDQPRQHPVGGGASQQLGLVMDRGVAVLGVEGGLDADQPAAARHRTDDLFDALLRQAGGRISSVRIDAIRENVFVATVTVHLQDRRSALDTRASDAIALALGNDAPIDRANSVLQRAGVQRDTVVPPEQEPTERRGTRSQARSDEVCATGRRNAQLVQLCIGRVPDCGWEP
jgi:bifunctional DNase/RNase